MNTCDGSFCKMKKYFYFVSLRPEFVYISATLIKVIDLSTLSTANDRSTSLLAVGDVAEFRFSFNI